MDDQEKYRFFCKACNKEIKDVSKDFPHNPHETCPICKQEMELQKHLIGTDGADFGWVKM